MAWGRPQHGPKNTRMTIRKKKTQHDNKQTTVGALKKSWISFRVTETSTEKKTVSRRLKNGNIARPRYRLIFLIHRMSRI